MGSSGGWQMAGLQMVERCYPMAHARVDLRLASRAAGTVLPAPPTGPTIDPTPTDVAQVSPLPQPASSTIVDRSAHDAGPGSPSRAGSAATG